MLSTRKLIITFAAICVGISLAGCSPVNQDEAACQKYWNWSLNYEHKPPPAPEDEEPGYMKLQGAWLLELASHDEDTADHLDTLRKEAKSIEIRRAANAASDYWRMRSEKMFPFATALSEGSNELAKTLAGTMRLFDKAVMEKHIDAIDSVCGVYNKAPGVQIKNK